MSGERPPDPALRQARRQEGPCEACLAAGSERSRKGGKKAAQFLPRCSGGLATVASQCCEWVLTGGCTAAIWEPSEAFCGSAGEL